MLRRYMLLIAAFICAPLLIASAAFYAEHYRVREVGTLLNRPEAFAGDVNNFGDVVGAGFSTTLPFHAYLLRDGKAIDLGTLGGSYSAGRSVNDRRQVAGESTIVGDTNRHAFLWENGRMTDLGTLGGLQSEAYGINNHGQVVGWAWDATISLPKAVLWERGVIRPLPTPPDVQTSSASSINDRGMVAGTAVRGGNPIAVRWVNGEITFLGDLGGGLSYGNAINENGDVAGWAINRQGQLHAFLWRGGTMTDLGVLPNGTSSVALGINDFSEVAMTVSVGGRDHAALWRNGQLVDLGDLVPKKWSSVLGVAYGINQLGQVAVTTNADHALLLTPVGRPRVKVLHGPGSLKYR